MDESLKQAIETVKEQQPVSIDLDWYQGTIKLPDIKQFIRANINSASRCFVAIGYYLKYIRDKELYQEDGYQSIWELAQVEFGISKSQASKFMSINDRFSVDGNSPILQERYREFSSSKLSEMLYLTDEQLEQVTVGTTVAQIREIKKPDKVVSTSKQEPEKDSSFSTSKTESENYATSHKEPEQKSFYGLLKSIYPPDSLIATSGCGNKYSCWSCHMANCNIRQEECYCVEAPLGHPYPCTTMNIIDMVKDEVGSECMFINLDLVEWITEGSKEKIPCCKDCKHRCGYACRKVTYEPVNKIAPEPINDQPETVDSEPETVNDVDVTVIETADSVIEEPETVIVHTQSHCLDCKFYRDGAGDKRCKHCYADELKYEPLDSEEIETVEADIIQTVSEEPPKPIFSAKHHLMEAIKREEVQIAQLGESWKMKQPDTFLKHQTILIALKCYLTDMEYPVPEPVKQRQPELPKLKNNDQRRAFIEAYESWPIWIDIKETGERYYRYDLADKVAIIVKVSKQHAWRDYKPTKKVEYASPVYYLLGVRANYSTKVEFVEDDTRTFYECCSNMTMLIDYLREYQKKK